MLKMMRLTTVMLLVGLLVILMNPGAKAWPYCDNGNSYSLCKNCDNPLGKCCCTHEDETTPCEGEPWAADHCCWCSCFPAVAKVQQSDGNMKTMTELQVGHIISTINSDGDVVATEVIAFMKWQPNVHGIYSHIKTAKGNEVVMSPDHLILSATPGQNQTFTARFAKDVYVGDLLKVADGDGNVEISKVVGVKISVLKGAYVPLTKEGTLLVDGVLASSYASIDHDVAHFFVTPLRWFPGLFGAQPNTDGSHPYVDFIRNTGKWLMPGSLQRKNNRFWHFMNMTLDWSTATY